VILSSQRKTSSIPLLDTSPTCGDELLIPEVTYGLVFVVLLYTSNDPLIYYLATQNLNLPKPPL
jgi:hypothetical protein